MILDVYDFDGTLYSGDSSVDFWRFCVARQPALLRYLPCQLWGALGMKLHVLSPEKGKSLFFSFLRGVHLSEQRVMAFWEKNRNRLVRWFCPQPDAATVVISASPAFLLERVCAQMGVQTVIATDMDSATGCIRGCNCKGKEKVRRLYECFGEDCVVRSMYTDSMRADRPLLLLAERRFLVKKGQASPLADETMEERI